MAKAGFNNSEKLIKVPLVPISFTNAICYGKTGSGKTSGFILPNIENRIKDGHGILVYDFKGNLHEQVKMIASKYNKLNLVKEIGKPWGEKTNILNKIDSRSLDGIFRNLHGSSQDKYWENASSNLIGSIYKIQTNFLRITELAQLAIEKGIAIKKILFSFKTKEVSLRSIFNSIKSIESLQLFFKTCNSDQKLVEQNIKAIILENGSLRLATLLSKHLENIKKALDSIESYKKLDSNENSIGGLYGVLDVANSTLSAAAENEYINESSLDLGACLRNGEIVVINIGDIDDSTLSILNLSVYRSLQKNLNKQINSPVTIFIDEAQKVLHQNYLPDVDVCRESEFEYIFATQDKLLLESKIDKHNSETLLRNVVEQYSFATNDPKNETKDLEKFEYRDLISSRNRFADPIFFGKEELFDIEYDYQTYHDIAMHIDPREIEEIDERFILIESSELVDRGEVYIKTYSDKIIAVPIVQMDSTLIMEYLAKIEEDNAQKYIDQCDIVDNPYEWDNKSNSVKSYPKTLSLDKKADLLAVAIKKADERMKKMDKILNLTYKTKGLMTC